MKKKIIDKALILKKWGQEVSTGKPNPGLMGHQIILEGILEDFNWSDVVITINSTTGLESILKNKPCISFGSSYYSKFLKKYKYKYLEGHIPFYINDPSNKEQKLNNANLIDSLNQFSLDMQESEKVWENKILNNFKKEIKPFHENNELIKYVTFEKYVRLRNNIRNKLKKLLTFVLKKIMWIIQYINNQIL